MIKKISFSEFCDDFRKTNKGNFSYSYNGKRALYDYLEEYEESTGTPVELDIVALCCKYSEYDSAWEAMKQYQPEDMPVEGEEGDDLLEIAVKNEKAALEWLQDRTTVITFDKGIIIQHF